MLQENLRTVNKVTTTNKIAFFLIKNHIYVRKDKIRR